MSAIAYTGLAAALAVFAYFWLRVNLPKDEERIFDYVNQRDNLKIAVKLKVICPGANSQRVADIVRHQFEMTYAENSEDYRRVADYVRNSLIEELALPKERHNEVKVFLVERSQEVERKRNPRTIVLGDK